jgi:putative DNA primase/helicase
MSLEKQLAEKARQTQSPKPKRRRKPKSVGTDATDPLSVQSPEGQTDVANARRFIQLHGDDVRYCHPWKKWLVWDGQRWKLDDDGGIIRLGKSVPDAVWREALASGDDRARRYAAATASDAKIRAMLSLAAAEVPIQPNDMDANPWLLNCPNGTVDLRTGKLREHRREDSLTQLCPTAFNPEAESYAWDRFLEDVFDGDGELIEFVQRLFGYILTGDVREQVLPIFWGSGANGKSTLLNSFMHAVGPDYSMQAVPDLLMQKRSDGHPTERADLFRKRFVSAVETEQNRKLAESMVKMLTGGERIRVRRMREDFWEFEPTHKIVLCTNHRPEVKGQDNAIWRRLRLVPFTVRFEGDRQDKTLPEKLAVEAEGILAWAVRGCVEWLRDGLGEPAAVSVATKEYRSEQDVLGRFVNDCCLTGDPFVVKFSLLYAAIERWCDDVGDETPKKRTVGQFLKERGYQEKHSNGRWYVGITLKPETDDRSDGDS